MAKYSSYIKMSFTAAALAACCLPFSSATAEGPGGSAKDVDRVANYIATAHLDTQWRWTIQSTIAGMIPRTLHQNFDLIDKYPEYNFNFEGAFRYMLIKEYYPEEYERLKKYIDAGRWHICGSAVDAGDSNVVSPESFLRHVLYGNGFFRDEFDKESVDIFIPDSFGFGWMLPSVAAHCGLKGFSSQKLTWGSAVGIPFNIGFWTGIDGKGVVAILNPGHYMTEIKTDLSCDQNLIDRIDYNGTNYGFFADYRYYGVGDMGGSPTEQSVQWIIKSMGSTGPVRIVSAPADRFYKELTPEQVSRLPRWNDELVMTKHGVGCYTSQAYMKRWNRANELLASSAEMAASAADWLGGGAYPHDKLHTAWVRFLWHQFHDDITGTSLPEAYAFSWNDEVLSLNQFASVLEDGAGAVARALDTRASGVPLVVYNPVEVEREDVVEATATFEGAAPAHVRVLGPDGREVPSQVVRSHGNSVELLFLAKVPGASWSVFDVVAADSTSKTDTGLKVSQNSLENNRYLVRLDANGDVAGITDKANGRELLSAPIQLHILHDEPNSWPAWEIDYDDISEKDVRPVGGAAQVKIAEAGPVRVSIDIVREAEGSKFAQRISLAAGGAGNRVEFGTDINWKTPASLVKAVFPMSVENEKAVYDLGWGVIARTNNTPMKYEVPAQHWAGIAERSGKYGVAVMNDSKYGWDKPTNNVLRLTLVRTPGTGNFASKTLDFGRHTMSYAIAGHTGDWLAGGVNWEAAALNRKLVAFQAPRHDGALGKSFSFATIGSRAVALRALKKSESGESYVIRLQNLGKSPLKNIAVGLGGGIAKASELNGAEKFLRDIPVGKDGRLHLDFAAFEPRTISVELAKTKVALERPQSVPVELPFNLDTTGSDKADGNTGLNGGSAIPAELFPREIVAENIAFMMGDAGGDENNALVCNGQEIALPDGDFNRVYLLAHAIGGPVDAAFSVDGKEHRIGIQDYAEHVGQWDSRVVNGIAIEDVDKIAPGYIKRDPVAWVATHRHDSEGGNIPYVYTYMFKYGIPISAGAKAIKLPDDSRIRIFAISAANNDNALTRPAQLLYERLSPLRVSAFPGAGAFVGSASVELKCAEADATLHYTLDGSEPNEKSPVAGGPIRITKDSTVRVLAIKPGLPPEIHNIGQYRKVDMRKAANPADVVAGIECGYYEYKALESVFPEFSPTNVPAKTMSMERMVIPTQDINEDSFALKFSGYISVPEDGAYRFYMSCDDKGKVLVGDTMVVESDIALGDVERVGEIGLQAGLHPITVIFVEGGGAESFSLMYDGPGIAKRRIPPEVLYRHR